MKCPICGNTLTPSKKNPNFMLCHECRKKFRLKSKEAPAPKMPVSEPAEEAEAADRTQVYSRAQVRAALEREKVKSAKRPAPKPVQESDDDDVEFHFRYANIPPKEIREKQEREMRKAYDELLSIGKEEKSKKKRGLFGRRKG